MAKKGFATEAQLNAERDRLTAVLAELKRAVEQQELARRKAALTVYETEFERLTRAKLPASASPADLDKARIAVAEARIELACLNIREEWQAIVEARRREVERTLKAVEQKLVPATDLDRARKMLDEARRNLAEAEK